LVLKNPDEEEFILATIQTLKIDETVTIPNDNGDSNYSDKLPEEETGIHPIRRYTF
jgi:hypothetical protein